MNSVVRTLGEAKIRNMCKNNGLGDKDFDVIIEIFDEWELIWENNKKIAIAIQKTENHSNREKIIETVVEISMEYAMNSLRIVS